MPGVTEYPNGFANGITIRGMPLLQTHPGEVFFVNNSGVLARGGIGGSDGNSGTYKKPFLTLDYAIGRCTAARGDIIVLMPGHVEEVTAAAAITCDVQGIAIVGLGIGSLQPQLHFTTDAASDIDITAADVTFYNINFKAGVSDITPGALDIGAAAHNLTLQNCLFDEDGSDENYIIVANIADGCDGLWMEGCTYIGNDVGNDHLLEFAGTHENVVIIDNHFAQLTSRTATVGLIEVATTATNIRIERNNFVMEDAAVEPGCVVLTGTANNGVAKDNVITTPDSAATAANLISAFDVTGVGAFGNLGVTTADLGGAAFNTAETYT
jgi:hypothetical protein